MMTLVDQCVGNVPLETRAPKMARGPKYPPKEGCEKIRILISSGLAVGALRTHNQSANSTKAN